MSRVKLRITSTRNADRVAIDAGPIIALINRRDAYHEQCKGVLRDIPVPMFTVWPAVVEAYYLLERDAGPSEQLLHWLQAAHVRIIDLRMQEIRRMWQLIRKYRDLPMDLADAALVAACERMKIRKVLTVDRRDFLIYRPSHVDQFEVLP